MTMGCTMCTALILPMYSTLAMPQFKCEVTFSRHHYFLFSPLVNSGTITKAPYFLLFLLILVLVLLVLLFLVLLVLLVLFLVLHVFLLLLFLVLVLVLLLLTTILFYSNRISVCRSVCVSVSQIGSENFLTLDNRP